MIPYYTKTTIDGTTYPPIVERWPECRPKRPYTELRVSTESEGHIAWVDGDDEYYCSDDVALALTRCAVMEACGKVLDSWPADDESRVAAPWVAIIGHCAVSGNDTALNELAHRLHMETTR